AYCPIPCVATRRRRATPRKRGSSRHRFQIFLRILLETVPASGASKIIFGARVFALILGAAGRDRHAAHGIDGLRRLGGRNHRRRRSNRDGAAASCLHHTGEHRQRDFLRRHRAHGKPGGRDDGIDALGGVTALLQVLLERRRLAPARDEGDVRRAARERRLEALLVPPALGRHDDERRYVGGQLERRERLLDAIGFRKRL